MAFFELSIYFKFSIMFSLKNVGEAHVYEMFLLYIFASKSYMLIKSRVTVPFEGRISLESILNTDMHTRFTCYIK